MRTMNLTFEDKEFDKLKEVIAEIKEKTGLTRLEQVILYKLVSKK